MVHEDGDHGSGLSTLSSHKRERLQIRFLILSGSMRHESRPLVRTISVTCALAICFFVSGSVAAQRRKPAPKPATNGQKQPIPVQNREPELRLEALPEDPSVENADVAITARVKARSLKFDVVPNPSVEFPGQPARDTVWEAERENLPTPVQPGVTYRDIGIRLKITSRFTDIDRIVAEALGEVPVTDDDKPVSTEATKKPSISPRAVSPNSQTATSRTPPKERR